MSAPRLHQLSAAALIGSFALSLAGGMAHPIIDGNSHSAAALLAPRSPWAQLLIYAGALLLMLGLPAMIGWLSERGARTAVAGGIVYFLGNALSAQSHLVVEAFVAPAIARDPGARHLVPPTGEIVDAAPFVGLQVVGGLVLVAGLFLLGIGLLRAAGVPRWIGVVFLAAGVLAMTPLPEVPVLTGLQIELFRGLGVAAVAVLMLKGIRESRRPAVAADLTLAH